jgi:tetraacyldisaccharide 4'-kinase
LNAASLLQLVRPGLWPLSVPFWLLSGLRGVAYDRGWLRSEAAGVPVLSVGNLTVGGTGKTPLVLWLAAELRALGRRPGVAARGYRRAPGAELNDEGLLLARRLPGLLQRQDKDRLAAARALVAAGADVVVLDDGFQHRRLQRDVDIVCLDADRPFGNGLLLPAGELRERPRALRRAHVAVLTRADAIAAEALAERRQRLLRLAPHLELYACAHRPRDVVRMPELEPLPLTALRGRRCVLLSGIARPQDFAASVQALGGEIVRHVVRPDHAGHAAAVVGELGALARARDAWLVTTEKDDVKLGAAAGPRHVLRIDLQFLGPPPKVAAWLARA